MRRFLLQRAIRALLTLAILSVVIFLLARATGDPLTLILPPEASAEDRANVSPILWSARVGLHQRPYRGLRAVPLRPGRARSSR